jgi:hypothetical protein
MERQLEQRRVISERLAEQREAGDGYTDAARPRSIRQVLPAWFAHRAQPSM